MLTMQIFVAKKQMVSGFLMIACWLIRSRLFSKNVQDDKNVPVRQIIAFVAI